MAAMLHVIFLQSHDNMWFLCCHITPQYPSLSLYCNSQIGGLRQHQQVCQTFVKGSYFEKVQTLLSDSSHPMLSEFCDLPPAPPFCAATSKNHHIQMLFFYPLVFLQI